MPTNKVINSLNAGELSPYLYARSDFEKYSSGCLTMENFVPLSYGGATRRPALEYLGGSKNNGKVRMIPFIANIEDAYMLELGAGYIRFWKNGALIEDGGSPLEIGTPYSVEDLAKIKYSQSIDVRWLTHPDYPIQRISRYADSDTAWTNVPEEFQYPPLLDMNDTDITMSPSATIGTITLTASRDFFDAGHVGSSMAFDTVRLLANAAITDTTTVTHASEPLYVSNANWEATTSGTWTGRVLLQRSLDNKATWHDYLVLGDTTGAASGGEKNFSIASDREEATNTWIRLYYIDDGGTFNYSLKTSDPWKTLVDITERTDAKNVIANIRDEFQYIESEFSEWTKAEWSVGTKKYRSAEISYNTEPVVGEDHFPLATINAGLTDVTGMCSATVDGEDCFALTTNGTSNKKVYIIKWDGAAGSPWTDDWDNVASFDVSTEFSSVTDVACPDDGYLYVIGQKTTGLFAVARYTVPVLSVGGVFVDFCKTLDSEHDKVEGLGYYNGYFYVTGVYSTGGASKSFVRQYTTGFSYTGGLYKNITTLPAYHYSGVAGTDGKIYVTNPEDLTIDCFSESLDLLDSSPSSPSTDPQGLCFQQDFAWVCDSGGNLYKYSFAAETLYYECVKETGSGDVFSNDSWSIRDPLMTTWSEGAFSDYRGHPRSIAMYENRLAYGGTKTDPDAIWLSKTDDYNNFTMGELDDDAMKLTLNSGQNDKIRWMVPQANLVIGTAGSEWELRASDERHAVSPTSYDLKRMTTYGSNGLPGILVNSAVLFMMRQSRKVREWTPAYDLKDYVAPDMSILAEHITKGGVTEWAYQQQPDNILWSIRGDGTLLGLTYERDQNVVGWHRHSNSELSFESVAVLPRDNAEDEVWAVVLMGSNHYLTRLNDREWGTDYLTEWQGSDLYKVYTAPGSTTLTGLDHLEGKTVSVVADGVVKANAVVLGGEITIDASTYTTVVVGLPFTSTVEPMHINLETRYGSSQGNKTDIRTAKVQFKDTFSAKCGQQHGELEAVRFNPDDSGLHSDYGLAWFENSSEFLQTCKITQDEPMPCTVLAVIPEIEART